MSKKILFFVGGSYVYGKEKVMLTVMEQMKTCGHDVFCVVNGWNNRQFTELLRQRDIQHRPAKLGRLYHLRRLKYLFWNLDGLMHFPAAFFAVKKLIKNFNPEVLYFTDPTVIVMLQALLKNHNIILHHHDKPVASIYWKLFFKISQNLNIKHISVSDFIKNELIEQKVPQNLIQTIYNPITLKNNFDRKYIPKDHHNDSIIFGIIGQIGSWKGHDILFDALSIAQEKKINCELIIAGTGAEEYIDFLKNKAMELNIQQKITWLGYVNNPERFYEKIDVCIVPSCIEEAFGLTAIEAASFSRPVIASKRGGLVETVRHLETGLLVAHNSSSQLAEAMLVLANNADLREKLAKQAKIRATELFNIEDFSEKINAIINTHSR